MRGIKRIVQMFSSFGLLIYMAPIKMWKRAFHRTRRPKDYQSVVKTLQDEIGILASIQSGGSGWQDSEETRDKLIALEQEKITSLTTLLKSYDEYWKRD